MKSTLAIIATSIAALASAPAFAETALTVDGGWQYFSFGNVGSSFSNQPFTFTLTESAVLRVTDAYLSGDQFEVFGNGTSLGLTSTPTLGFDLGGDYDAAFASDNFSHGQWTLAAGTYSITGLTVLSPYSSGGAAISLSAVPEPGSIALMLAGVAVLGARLKRRQAR